MKKWHLLAALCATALVAGSAQATVVNINFDDVPGNTLLNTAYGGLGVTFNDTAAVHLGGGGVTSQPNFASGMAGNDVTTLVLTFDNYATSIGAYNVTIPSSRCASTMSTASCWAQAAPCMTLTMHSSRAWAISRPPFSAPPANTASMT